ncbi:MAG: alpha/beta hydrolase [Burkholderiaceae bacterium]
MPIELAARRFETPCGDGSVVWHTWGDGEPVVLLHGGSGSWTPIGYATSGHWASQAAGSSCLICLAQGFRRPPLGEDADVLPEWIELGLDLLVNPSAVDLVGFSFGSMVACLMATRRPAQVRQLVLAGAPALSTEPMNPLMLRAWAHLPEGEARTAIHRHNLATLMLAGETSIDELSLGIHADNLARDRMKRRRLSKTDILMRTLPAVQCRVDGIWGARDVLYLGRQHLIERGLSLAPRFGSLTLIEGRGTGCSSRRPIPSMRRLSGCSTHEKCLLRVTIAVDKSVFGSTGRLPMIDRKVRRESFPDRTEKDVAVVTGDEAGSAKCAASASRTSPSALAKFRVIFDDWYRTVGSVAERGARVRAGR